MRDVKSALSRRRLLSILGTAPLAGRAGLAQEPAALDSSAAGRRFHHRQLGRTGKWVAPFGLGGQGALQWTPEGADPADIVVRAIELGVNYLDTANSYGPSQSHFNQAFRRLRLCPDQRPFNGALRERLFIAAKTAARYSRNPEQPDAPTAVPEMKRALSELFGDGSGRFPEGAYLDSIQVENIATLADVDAIYEGLSNRGGGRPERIGALAGLRDYRDGTNYSGQNPDHRIHVKHIGITGHQSSMILMNALRRDEEGVFDTLLVALNANDRNYCAHQNNVLPVAVAKGIGVVAMKAFADGVFYGKRTRFSQGPDDVVQSVGKEDGLSHLDLIRYPASLPGVACVVTGVGHIHRENPEDDQIAVNLAAVVSDLVTRPERIKTEQELRSRGMTRTNYFQDPPTGLVQPGDVSAKKDGDRILVSWNSALAGAEAIQSYLVLAGERLLLSVPFRPQTTLAPLTAVVPASSVGEEPVSVVASNLPAWMRRPENPGSGRGGR